MIAFIGYEHDNKCPNCQKWGLRSHLKTETRIIDESVLEIEQLTKMMVAGKTQEILLQKPMLAVTRAVFKHFKCQCGHEWEKEVVNKRTTEATPINDAF